MFKKNICLIVFCILISCCFVSAVRSFVWDTDINSEFSDTNLSSTGLDFPKDNTNNNSDEKVLTEEEKELLREKNNLFIAQKQGYKISEEDKKKLGDMESEEKRLLREKNKDLFIFMIVGIVILIFIIFMMSIKNKEGGDI